MSFWINLAILVITSLISYALSPKAPKSKPPSLEDFEVPTAEAGRPVPVVFGEVTIRGPNCVWYGDLEVRTETEDGVRRRFYDMGMHFAICAGPIDAFVTLYYANKVAWGIGSGSLFQGFETPQTTSTQIRVINPNLLGGEDREGGISGYFDLMFGESTQGVNGYLVEQLGTPQPAYRGVFCIVGRKPYVSANSQYIKNFAFKVRRIEKGWHLDSCWYPETANVPGDTTTDSYDVFAQGDEGGTALDYWWKLNTDLVASDEDNVGSAGTMPIQLLGTTTSANVEQAAVTLGTTDELSLQRSGGYQNWLNVPGIDVTTNAFTAGGWFNLAGATQQILFRSNVGGTQGYWRGIDVYAVNTGQIQVILGDNAGGYYRLDTASGVIDGSSRHMWALYCQPGFSLAITLANLMLYIDGEAVALTYVAGSASSVAWPVTASVPDGWTGIAFDSTGDTYGAYPEGYRDEVFYHEGNLGPSVISELWRRGSGGSGQSWDMNPAHIVYQAIADPVWGMGYSSTIIDDASFRAAADTFYGEGMGLSLLWNRQEPVEDFIQHILDHAGAVLGIDPSTGKFTLTPIRADYTVGTLPVFDESNVVAVQDFDRYGYGELVGEVNVVYHEKATDEDATVSAQNLAAIQSQSGVVSETMQYPGISRQSLASRVAMRDLRSRSVPLARGKLLVNREAWSITPGDPFVLSWSKLGLSSVVCRCVEIDTGTLTDGVITLTFVEDVFGLPSSSYAANQAGLWTDPILIDTETATTEARTDEEGVNRQTEAGTTRMTE